MDKIEFINGEVANLKRKSDAGSFPALVEAFLLCSSNNHPLDDWVAAAVHDELVNAYTTGKLASGKRGQGSPRAKYKNSVKHHMRWSVARHWLNNREVLPGWGHPATRDGAFAFASEQLRGTAARGEPPTIEESFEEVERSMKNGTYVNFDD